MRIDGVLREQNYCADEGTHRKQRLNVRLHKGLYARARGRSAQTGAVGDLCATH